MNARVNLLDFCSRYVIPELSAADVNERPMLKVSLVGPCLLSTPGRLLLLWNSCVMIRLCCRFPVVLESCLVWIYRLGVAIAQAACIKFLSTFRNQFDGALLTAAIPHLGRFLSARSVVVHTYAAVAIEKLVMVRAQRTVPHVHLYTHAHIRCYCAVGLAMALAS